MPVYKNQKRGTWYAKFNYVDWTGKTKQKKKEGFLTQKDAKKYERDFLNKAKADCDILFKNLVDLYLEDSLTRLKPTSYANKKNLLETKIKPYFDEMPINSITPSTIRSWQNMQISDRQNYSQTYLKHMSNQLSSIFNYAVRYYNLDKNPVEQCGSMGKKYSESVQFWTTQEFDKFIRCISDNPISEVVFNLLFWTGMRQGEMMALTGEDIDFAKKTININKNFAIVNGKELILTPKTPKSKRVITMPDFISELLENYISRIHSYKPTQRLFPINKSYLYREIVKGCKKSGVKKVRVHDLRHSHASLLIELGFSPLLISERLGHENIETTLRTYSHLYPNKQVQVSQKLDEIAHKNI